MFLTLDEIMKYANPCDSGVQWFKDNYPNGVELVELLSNPDKKPPLHNIQWGFTHFSLNEAELAAYKALIHMENCSNDYLCVYCKDSFHLANSDHVFNSNHIYSSTGVRDARYVSSSNSVNTAHDVYDSKFITKSKYIAFSKNITNGRNIVNTTFATDSRNIFLSQAISNSSELRKCANLQNCYMCSDCSDSHHLMFCSGITNGSYLLFNKPVDPGIFNMIVEQYKEYMDIIANYGEWPFQPDITTAPNITYNYRKHYQHMTKDQMEWITTLPNFDKIVIYGLTFNNKWLTEN